MTISDKSAKYIMCLILFCMSLQLPRIYVIAFILCVMNVQLDIHVYIYVCSTAEFDKKCFVQIKLKLKEIVCYFIASIF